MCIRFSAGTDDNKMHVFIRMRSESLSSLEFILYANPNTKLGTLDAVFAYECAWEAAATR